MGVIESVFLESRAKFGPILVFLFFGLILSTFGFLIMVALSLKNADTF